MAEKLRYRNPVTNRIEMAEPAYAAVCGLVLFDGVSYEIETEKVTGIEFAILRHEEYAQYTKEELQDFLRELGEPVSGNKDELIARLISLPETPSGETENKNSPEGEDQ